MAESKLVSTTILVTGGSGLVGHGIQWLMGTQSGGPNARRDGENWVFLSSADGDLRDFDAAEALFRKHRPDMVIHLAAKVGGVYQNSRSPVDFLQGNLSIDQNVLRLSHQYNVAKVVSCLSTCIFPDKTSYPIDETMLHSGPPHDSNFGYAHAKRMIDVSNRAYKAQYGCNFTAVIPTNVYGLHDNFREGCHFIPGIVKRVHDAKVRGESTIHVPGTGTALRQFIYSRDLAALIVRTLREYNSCEPLILSVGEEHETSISDTVKLVCALSGFKGEITWDDSKADGQLKKTADNSKMRSLMGDFEFTPFEQGLRETIQWYDANADNAQAKEQIIL